VEIIELKDISLLMRAVLRVIASEEMKLEEWNGTW
jgi:hypothetical protein